MNRNDEVRAALAAGEPLFYPDTDKAFRAAFRQRWYSDIKTRHKRRIKAQPGTHEGQEGTFIWTEEIK